MSNQLISKSTRYFLLQSCLLTVLASPIPAFAAAFAVNQQSITYLGYANAGTASSAQDASTSFYNPAGLRFLGKDQVVLSGAYNYSHIKLYDATATNSEPFTVSGTNPSKPSANTFVPGFNSALQINKRIAIGLSIVELFATNIKYDGNSIARYMATTTKISTIDLSPSIGLKLNDKFYIGAALDFMKTNMNISSSVAWGHVGSEANGFVNNTMNGWSYGYHLGALYTTLDKKFRMGLVYFSRFSPNLSGNTYSAGTLDFGTPPPNKVTSNFSLPDRLTYGVTAALTEKLTGMAEIEWTHWSRLRTMTLAYNSTALPGTLVFDFKNTWRFSLGGDYAFTRSFVLKGGVAYDQTPVNKSLQTVRVPENNRYIIALGLKYGLGKWFALEGAYSHVFMKSFNINETAASESLNTSPNAPNRKSLSGKFSNSTDIFGLQLIFTFS